MKKAIVMGATSGIGLEVARLLARQGYAVGVAGRRADRLAEAVNAEANIVVYRPIDVNDTEAAKHLHELIDELGGMNLYFHSSGIGWENCELNTERELLTVQTNAMGFTRMVTAAFNYMAQHNPNGRIACITSIARTRGLGAAPAYSATKRFQAHYLECLAQQACMHAQAEHLHHRHKAGLRSHRPHCGQPFSFATEGRRCGSYHCKGSETRQSHRHHRLALPPFGVGLAAHTTMVMGTTTVCSLEDSPYFIVNISASKYVKVSI